MSCDIMLLDREDNEIKSMNWVRNPFGLVTWAEDNVGEGDKALWHVINDHTYDDSNNVNRFAFKDVVERYYARLCQRHEGYFFFDLPAYRQFVEPYTHYFETEKMPFGMAPKITDSEYVTDDRGMRLKIGQWQFRSNAFNLGHNSFESYLDWFNDLVVFAQMLQDPELKYYCSN